MTTTNKNDKPAVIIFAGPNGSGKSTITNSVVSNPDLFTGEYINADDIAIDLESQIPNYKERNLKAAALAEERRLDALRDGRDFAFETVMSTPEKVALMTQAQALGYRVSLFFVTTENADINVDRVIGRAARGGHTVAPDTIKRRYKATMDLLSCAFEKADEAFVLDNSTLSPNGQGSAILVAKKVDDQVDYPAQSNPLPWVQQHLIDPFLKRLASRKMLAAKAAGRSIAVAEAVHGKDYVGVVLHVANFHILQDVGGQLLEHDRALMATDASVLSANVEGTVSYRYEFGKIAPIEESTPDPKTRPTP